MSDEISIHQVTQPGTRRGLRPRTWLALGLVSLVVLIGLGMLALMQPMLRSSRPDTVQLLSVTPNGGPNGQFTIRLRLQRADHRPLSAAISTTADLLDAKSGKQLLGRQCGFQVQQATDQRWMDVTLLGNPPAGLKAPRRVRAKVEVQVMPPQEMFQMFLWTVSGRKLPQPQFMGSHWHTLTHDLVLPPPPSTSSTGRESAPSGPK